jgi:hypothetical protein
MVTSSSAGQRWEGVGVGRATLCLDPALRALVDSHRHDAASAGTLTGLADDIAALRTAIKAVAARGSRPAPRRINQATQAKKAVTLPGRTPAAMN